MKKLLLLSFLIMGSVAFAQSKPASSCCKKSAEKTTASTCTSAKAKSSCTDKHDHATAKGHDCASKGASEHGDKKKDCASKCSSEHGDKKKDCSSKCKDAPAKK